MKKFFSKYLLSICPTPWLAALVPAVGVLLLTGFIGPGDENERVGLALFVGPCSFIAIGLINRWGITKFLIVADNEGWGICSQDSQKMILKVDRSKGSYELKEVFVDSGNQSFFEVILPRGFDLRITHGIEVKLGMVVVEIPMEISAEIGFDEWVPMEIFQNLVNSADLKEPPSIREFFLNQMKRQVEEVSNLKEIVQKFYSERHSETALLIEILEHLSVPINPFSNLTGLRLELGRPTVSTTKSA